MGKSMSDRHYITVSYQEKNYGSLEVGSFHWLKLKFKPTLWTSESCLMRDFKYSV